MEIMDSLARSLRVELGEHIFKIRKIYPEFWHREVKRNTPKIPSDNHSKNKNGYTHKIICYGMYKGKIDDLSKKIQALFIQNCSLLCDGDKYLYEMHVPCKIMFVMQSLSQEKYNIKIEFFVENLRKGSRVLKGITTIFKNDFVIKSQ